MVLSFQSAGNAEEQRVLLSGVTWQQPGNNMKTCWRRWAITLGCG
jgi:hypothetical protein